MRVFPEAEEGDAEINQERYRSQKEKNSRRHSRVLQRTNERINQQRKPKPEIQARATRTDGEFVFSDEVRPLRNLMAKRSKCPVNTKSHVVMITCRRQRRHDDHTQYK